MNTFKSCAICKHCEISLGYDVGRPAYPKQGHFECDRNHKLPFALEVTDQLRVLARECPEFELMDDPK